MIIADDEKECKNFQSVSESDLVKHLVIDI